MQCYTVLLKFEYRHYLNPGLLVMLPQFDFMKVDTQIRIISPLPSPKLQDNSCFSCAVTAVALSHLLWILYSSSTHLICCNCRTWLQRSHC